MTQDNSPIQPKYLCNTPNENIILFQGSITVSQEETEFTCIGRIDFHWFPKVGHKFYVESDLCYSVDISKEVQLRFSDPQIIALAQLNQKTFTRSNGIILSGYILESELKCEGLLASVTFSLANFEDSIRGLMICKENTNWPGRLILEADPWRITIDSCYGKDKEVAKLLREQGGYAVTHTGKILNLEKQFSPQEAENILFGLSRFLSFLSGDWVMPMLPVGFNSKNDIVWEKWLRYYVDPYQNRSSWLPKSETSQLSNLFQGFMKKWDDLIWKESVMLLLYWYVEANTSGIEQGILIAQSAFELLAWIVLVQDRKVLSEDALNSLKAEDTLRLLFSWLQIPIKMPPLPEPNILHLDALQKLLRSENNLTDCPGCITQIRNRITHPKKKQGQTSILKYSDDERWESWNLSMWYFELSLLRLFDYKGVYSNRLKKERWYGSYDVLPWMS